MTPAPEGPATDGVRRPRIAAVVLAAGRSQRMGRNKLLSQTPRGPLVRHAVEAALASHASPVVVVTGHEGEAVCAALDGCGVEFVRNEDYAQGLATSLAKGIGALPPAIDGAVICLGDMPEIRAGVIDRLIAAYNPAEGRAIIVPTHDGRRGNPVLWGRRFFPALAALAGDVGGRALLEQYEEWVAPVAVDDSVLIDVDTPDMLADWLSRHA